MKTWVVPRLFVLLVLAFTVVGAGTEVAAAPPAQRLTKYSYDVTLHNAQKALRSHAGLARVPMAGTASDGRSNVLSRRSVPADDPRFATNSGGARFVAGSDGIVDTVGGSRNAISLGKYNQVPNYIDDAAATGSRAFSISDDVWNAMSPAEQVLRNERFLDDVIARGSEIRLASPPTRANLTGAYADEIAYLQGKGYTISSDGTQMIPPGG